MNDEIHYIRCRSCGVVISITRDETPNRCLNDFCEDPDVIGKVRLLELLEAEINEFNRFRGQMSGVFDLMRRS